MPRLCVVASAVGLFMITVVGCGDADPQSSGSKVTPVAGGTTTCDYRLVSTERDADGADNILERWTCTVEMSDGRVSGTEELEFMTRWFPGNPAGVATGEGVLTTEQGVWRGGGEALVDFSGPYNFGEMTYLGEGEYAGLTYRYMYYGTNSGAEYAGWIEPTD